jgi:hypothetical protein
MSVNIDDKLKKKMSMSDLAGAFKRKKVENAVGTVLEDGSTVDYIQIKNITAVEKVGTKPNKWGKLGKYMIFSVKYLDSAGNEHEKNILSFTTAGRAIVEYINDDFENTVYKVVSHPNEGGFYDFNEIHRYKVKKNK